MHSAMGIQPWLQALPLSEWQQLLAVWELSLESTGCCRAQLAPGGFPASESPDHALGPFWSELAAEWRLLSGSCASSCPLPTDGRYPGRSAP